jgi:hypothetical protein
MFFQAFVLFCVSSLLTNPSTCGKEQARFSSPRTFRAAIKKLLKWRNIVKEDLQRSRRTFLTRVGAATVAAGVIGVEPLIQPERSEVHAANGSNQRANECVKLRRDAAVAGLQTTPQNLQHPSNQDEELYPNKLGSYSKGLPHNNDGTVVASAYAALLKAINSGQPADFDAIPLAGTTRLTNPQAGLAFDIEGPDAHALVQPPAPAFASRAQAAEISENYCATFLTRSMAEIRSRTLRLRI